MNILKPKTEEEIIKNFCDQNKISQVEFTKVVRYLRLNRAAVNIKAMFTWVMYIFIIVFGMSMIINGGIALSEKYFWFPIKETRNMLNFINIFWIVSWFGIGIAIIVYGISMISRITERKKEYEKYNRHY